MYWDVRDELITLVGNVALVRATNKEIVRRDGRDEAAMTTYTDTYVYERGSWKCIQAQDHAGCTGPGARRRHGHLDLHQRRPHEEGA
jgi:hypothetical protein